MGASETAVAFISTKKEETEMQDKIVRWAAELQSLAQAGLYYGRDVYDRERYQRMREIAAEMLAERVELPLEKVRDLFCGETGYQTPKIDTRAAVIANGKILLVQERNGKWALPGGWCDYDLSPAENTVKEAREEAGAEIEIVSLIAATDRKKHNQPLFIYNILQMFYLCRPLGGAFRPNTETTAAAYFPENALPPLAEDRNTAAQIHMCFEASRAEHWAALFD